MRAHQAAPRAGDQPSAAGAPLPPSPMAAERVVRGARDVPLPWATPFVVAAMGLAPAGAFFALIATTGYAPDQACASATALLWQILAAALGATILDHHAAKWATAGRWALGMGLLGLVPNPAMVISMAASGHIGWKGVALWAVEAGAGGATLGAALGFARRSVEGVLWKLPLVGAGVVSALPVMLVVGECAVSAIATGGSFRQALGAVSVPWQIWVSLGILGAGGVAIGLGLALSLRWAVARSEGVSG
jgi:hypothetical protein